LNIPQSPLISAFFNPRLQTITGNYVIRKPVGWECTVRVHTRDVNCKGYVRHASEDDPQYEIKSDKTNHVAMHKGKALRRLGSNRRHA
jgi:hypothetical protein